MRNSIASQQKLSADQRTNTGLNRIIRCTPSRLAKRIAKASVGSQNYGFYECQGSDREWHGFASTSIRQNGTAFGFPERFDGKGVARATP